jgi:hypothetical protein
MNARMLVIDEIHCLLVGTYREQRIILNCIRFLANDLRIPIVCAGTVEAKTALMTDEQLADRFEAFELGVWGAKEQCTDLRLPVDAGCTVTPPPVSSETRHHVQSNPAIGSEGGLEAAY